METPLTNILPYVVIANCATMFALPLRLVLVLACIAQVSSASVTTGTATYDVSAVLKEIPIRHRIAAMTRNIKSVSDFRCLLPTLPECTQFRQAAKRLVNSEGSCRWDMAKDACVVGYAAAAELLGKSSNIHAQFFANFEVNSIITSTLTSSGFHRDVSQLLMQRSAPQSPIAPGTR